MMLWKKIVGCWTAFYLTLSLFYFIFGINKVDIITSLLMLLIFLFVIRWNYYIPAFSVFLIGLSFLLNAIGFIRFQYYNEIITLYSFPHYDLFVHFTGFILFSTGIYLWYNSKHKNKKLIHLVILSLAIIGTGALIETFEYLGYKLFGHGDSWLEFGEGDSGEFGPWQDAMEDMIANLFGIITGFSLVYLTKKGIRKRI
jgi:hypothetical protein